MFENLDIFRMSHAMAVHAGQRQSIAAENVANADTPEFKAREINSFSETYRNAESGHTQTGHRATRERHLHGRQDTNEAGVFEDPNGVASPNGNTVSLENEMLKSLNAKRQHDRALAIYKSSLGILRQTLSRN